MKEDYEKDFKKLTLFFLLNPVPFNKQSYQKQNRDWNWRPVDLQVTKQVQKNSFISYLLSEHV